MMPRARRYRRDRAQFLRAITADNASLARKMTFSTLRAREDLIVAASPGLKWKVPKAVVAKVSERTMAWDHDARLSLVVHGKSSPSSLEWLRFLNHNRVLGKRDLRVLVCTYGGGPDAGQRLELAEAVGHVVVPTVIMTNSLMARGIVSALNWFNPSIKVLSIDADLAAHRFLGLTAAESARALELRQKLERELGLGPFSRLEAPRSS